MFVIASPSALRRRPTRPRVRVAQGVFALVLALALGLAASAAAQAPGEPAPDFTLVDAHGEILRLSDFRGTPVVLNAWATWCPFCIDEIPIFEQANADLNAPPRTPAVAFLLVNLDEPFEPARRFLVDGLDSSLTGAYDPSPEHRARHEGTEFSATRQLLTRTYRVRGMPTTFFIDADGVVQRVKVGPILSRAELDALLASIGVASAAGGAR